MKRDPKLFGFLKGRWNVREIAKEIGKESGVKINKQEPCPEDDGRFGL